MALGRVEFRSRSAKLATLLVVMLLFAMVVSSRPVASGWDLSVSAGSSDTTLWRKFSTPAQAISYHRLLLDLENTRRVQQETSATEAEKAGAMEAKTVTTDPLPAEDFNSMDYAFPRTNEPGSSDSSTPPTP